MQKGQKPQAEGAERPPVRKATGDSLGSIGLGHISRKQLTVMMTYLLASKALFLFPTFISEKSGTAAWISIVVAGVLGLVGLAGWVCWCGATGDAGFVPSLRLTLGRFLGDAFAASLVVVALVLNSLNIRAFIGGAVIGLVPEFPIDALLYIFVLTTLYGAWLGLEPVVRTAVIFFLPTMLSLALAVVAMYRHFDLANLSPLWGFGVKNTLLQGVFNVGAFAPVPVVAVMKSFVRKHSDLAVGGTASLLMSVFMLVFIVVAVAGVFPYPMSTRKIEPLGVMARAVYLGRFLQRLEAPFTFTWFFAACVQASFTEVVILLLLAQLCDTRTFRPFVPAIAALTFGAAGLPANTLRAGQLVDRLITSGSGNLAVMAGWVLFLVAKLRHIRPGNKQEAAAPESRQSGRGQSEKGSGERGGP